MKPVHCPHPVLRLLLLFAGTALALPCNLPAGQLDLTGSEVGEEPDGLSVIDGEFLVRDQDGGPRAVEVSPTPLTEAGALFGDTMKGGGTVAASFLAGRKGRSMPRFGVGLHGISGHRLRLVPSANKVELLCREQAVASAAFDWKPGVAHRLELRIGRPEAAEDPVGWVVEAFVWEAGAPRPEAPLLTLTVEEPLSTRGKASIWATPYSGLPVRIFDIRSAAGQPRSEPDER